MNYEHQVHIAGRAGGGENEKKRTKLTQAIQTNLKVNF